MEALYDRIVTNEIKMKDESLLGGGADAAKAAAAASAGWLDTIMNLLPGRAKAASAEPNDEAIRRTHDYLRWGGQGGGWARGPGPCCERLAAPSRRPALAASSALIVAGECRRMCLGAACPRPHPA